MGGRHQQQEQETVAPTILPPGRSAGVCMHFTSLPGPYGIGDIGDAAHAFVDTLVDMRLGAWQFLPAGPTAYGDSPYQPLSAFAGNEMLLGIEPLQRLGLVGALDAEALTALPADTVDYGRLIPLKHELLAGVAGRFNDRAGAGLRVAYEEFLHLHSAAWLDDYAAYRIFKTMHGEKPWPEWEPAFVHREPAAVDRLLGQKRAALERIKVIQFLFDWQWRELKEYAGERGVRLFGDMPIYIALDSADAWARPEILLIDDAGRPSHVAGVPPDYFSADGQLWGNPLYDWAYHARHGYAWWIERVRHAAQRMDMVRIDHFRGFEAYWSIPFGAKTARTGEWLKGPADELFEALSAALGHLPIVAEDLGVITPEVDALRRRHGIPGMCVLQFDLADDDFSPADIPENSVCYTGTHDNDTTQGWFRGSAGDTRTPKEIRKTRNNALRLSGGKADTIHLDMIRLALDTKAKLAIFPLQDLLGLGSGARLNTPGTTSDNWRWRVRSEQLAAGVIEAMAGRVEKVGRKPPCA
jgi:4-alpha-glucanotransferase